MTAQEVERIHGAGLEVLEKTGIIVDEPTLLERFAEAGASVDEGSRRVKVPRVLVEWALKVAPKVITLCGRNPKCDVRLGEDRDEGPYFLAGHGCTHIYDPVKGEHRLALREDLAAITRLIDGLPHTDYVRRPAIPADIPIEMHCAEVSVEVLRNTEKHAILYPRGRESAGEIIEIASIVAGGLDRLVERPIISYGFLPVSPLMLDQVQCEHLMEFCSRKLPISAGSHCMAGTTSPVTLAGTLVLGLAETWAGLVAAQLMGEGTPVRCGLGGSCMDLRSGLFAAGAIERPLMSAAFIQIMRHFGLPVSGSGLSDSKVTDEQAAYEKGLAFLTNALAGAHVISGGGTIDSYFTVSYEQLVIDDEIMGMVRRLLRGIEVTPETRAVDLIDQVGPRGEFLTAAHTRRYMRKEISVPLLSNRQARPEWYKSGAKDVVASARQKVEQILASHRPAPLSDEVEKELQNYLNWLRNRARET